MELLLWHDVYKIGEDEVLRPPPHMVALRIKKSQLITQFGHTVVSATKKDAWSLDKGYLYRIHSSILQEARVPSCYKPR